MDEVSEPSWPRGVDWAFLLALATPFAYLMAYRFNVGYLQYFGVPSTLVDVALKDILYTSAVVLSVGYGVYMFLDAFLVFLPEKWPKTVKRRATGLFMMSIAVLYVLTRERGGWVAWSIAVAMFLLAVLFVMPRRRTVEGSAQTVVRPDPYAAKGVIPELMRAGVKRELVLAGFLVLMLSFMMKTFGGIVAMWTTDYLVHQSGEGVVCAVIRARDADLLCAEFEPSTNKLQGTYRFLEPNNAMLSLHKGRLEGPKLAKNAPNSRKP